VLATHGLRDCVLSSCHRNVASWFCCCCEHERHVRKASHCGSKQQWCSCAGIALSIACSRHAYALLFFAHIPFVVDHTINATPPERLQQHPLLFTTNHTDRTFFVWRLKSARPPHPGYSTIFLRTESPSGMCAKLHTVAASNNRSHSPRSLYFCLFAPHICIVVLRAHL